MSITYWWSEDCKWFCILADDGVCKSTVSLTQKESRDIAAAIDRLDVKVEATAETLGEDEARPSDHAPSNLLFYGLADAIGLSATIRCLGGGTIKHEFDRGGIKQLRDSLRPKAEAKSQEPEAVAYLPFDLPRWQQYEHRMKRLMQDVGMPNSSSLYQAMGQLIRDIEHIERNAHPTTKPEAPAVSVDAAIRERKNIERAFLLAADKAAASARAAARINLYGLLCEAYGAIEADLRAIARQISRGEEIINTNGLTWLPALAEDARS